MKNNFYIIPGYGESTKEKPYIFLSRFAKKKNFTVVEINPDWKKSMSDQILRIPSHSIIFGFSFGAVLAYLIAQKYPCKKLILASMTPISLLKKILVEELGFNSMNIKNIKNKKLKSKKIVRLYGDKEELQAKRNKIRGIKSDIPIKNTGHFLNKTYLKVITDNLT